MDWWEIIPDCNCLFAIDSRSKIEADSTKLLCSNDNSVYFTVVGNEKGLSKSLIDVGEEGFSRPLNTIKINGVNLLANEDIPIPRIISWVLLVKTNSENSSLAAARDGTSNWGFEFRRSFSSGKQGWNHSGLSTSGAVSNPEVLDKLHLMTLRIDKDSELVEVTTNYGATFSEANLKSFLTTSTSFANLPSLGYIGYNSSTWVPYVDIVAYGAFNKYLTEEDLDLIIETAKTKAELNTPFSFDSIYSYSNTEAIFDIKYNYNLNTVGKVTNVLTHKEGSNKNINVTNNYLRNLNLLYKNVRELSDVVTEESLPVQVKLYLYEKYSGVLIKTTMSDLEGRFKFTALDVNLEYVVTAHDPKLQFKSILKNYL